MTASFRTSHLSGIAGALGQIIQKLSTLNNTTPNAGYVYKVYIHTEDSHFVVDGEPRPVLSGMTVQADITTDRRRVIDFFLSPVVKYLDEGMKVR